MKKPLKRKSSDTQKTIFDENGDFECKVNLEMKWAKIPMRYFIFLEQEAADLEKLRNILAPRE